MSDFTLIDQVTEKAKDLPRNTLKNIGIISKSILKAGTVNLNKVKESLSDVRDDKERTPDGDYKFLTRFFGQGKVDDEASGQVYEELMKCIQTLCWLIVFGQSNRFGVRKFKHLILDGTKWEDGEQTTHLMTLCVLVGDVAVPVWWEDLCKAGHSSQEERTEMLKRAMKRYGLSGMTLLADREYTGTEWFKFLLSSGLYFVVRVKEGIYHEAVNGAKGPGWSRLKQRAKGKAKGKKVSKRICLGGMDLHYIILKNPRPKADDDLIFMVSNLPSPAQAARLYEWRWQIEVCFKHLKSNGINLEQMNVRGKEKRHLMMAMAVFVYCLAIREGLVEEHKKGVRMVLDKASGFYYRAVSVFRKGVSILNRKSRNAGQFIRYLQKVTNGHFLSLLQNV